MIAALPAILMALLKVADYIFGQIAKNDLSQKQLAELIAHLDKVEMKAAQWRQKSAEAEDRLLKRNQKKSDPVV